jgi:hypothetical protein
MATSGIACCISTPLAVPLPPGLRPDLDGLEGAEADEELCSASCAATRGTGGPMSAMKCTSVSSAGIASSAMTCGTHRPTVYLSICPHRPTHPHHGFASHVSVCLSVRTGDGLSVPMAWW